MIKFYIAHLQLLRWKLGLIIEGSSLSLLDSLKMRWSYYHLHSCSFPELFLRELYSQFYNHLPEDLFFHDFRGLFFGRKSYYRRIKLEDLSEEKMKETVSKEIVKIFEED